VSRSSRVPRLGSRSCWSVLRAGLSAGPRRFLVGRPRVRRPRKGPAEANARPKGAVSATETLIRFGGRGRKARPSTVWPRHAWVRHPKSAPLAVREQGGCDPATASSPKPRWFLREGGLPLTVTLGSTDERRGPCRRPSRRQTPFGASRSPATALVPPGCVPADSFGGTRSP